MKFEYAYKTPDGIRHVEEIEAPSREDVFATLRGKGIKAIKVVAKDGTKANGEVTVIGVKKRMVIGSVLVAAVVAVGVTLFVKEEIDPESVQPTVVTNTVPEHAATAASDVNARRRLATPLPRQMISGDRLRVKDVTTNLFAHVEEVYLSRYAEPGREVDVTDMPQFQTNAVEVLKVLGEPIYLSENEFTEYVDLKRITAGIKREMRNYLLAGGTIAEYLDELVKRQQLEISYYEKAERKLQSMIDVPNVKQQEVYDFWVKANAQLRSMGIYQIPLPDALRDFQVSFDLD